MKNVNIEAEGGELILKNKAGDYVIIPKDRRSEVQALIKSKCNSCIDAIVNTLPSMSNYAPDGTVIPGQRVSNFRATDSSANTMSASQYEQARLAEAQRLEDQRILADRRARLARSKAAKGKPLSPQQIADESAAIGDKLRAFPDDPNSIIDALNPAVLVGDLASGLGQVPLNIQEGNYVQAAVDIASPLVAGRLAGIGAQNTGQFVNNILNPLAGITDNIGGKLLPNAYKLNPYAVKEAQNKMLVRARPVGQDPYMNMAATLKAKQDAGEPLAWWQKSLLNPQTNPQLAAREKYYGQWFADNPSDLDFYINPATRNFKDDDQIELLKTILPKSEANNFKVKNFDDAKLISNLHDTEYILPKEMVQNLERFPLEDLPKLQEEYKKLSTPHWLKGYKERGGKMIKRADGTYSRRGLWDNIRANIGSGKEPTKEMLEQEKKIKAEDGLVISELYKQRTGKDWSTAKSEGLTTGSFSDNMKLRARLLSGELDNTRVDSQVATKVVTPSLEINAKDFNEAFKVARNSLGPNQIFEYKGKKYGTNVKGENFQPSKEVLAANNMNTPFVQSRLSEQNKMVSSVYSDKETVKLEPSYQDWETVKKRKQEINSMNQADIIREYNKNSKDQYLILDKKKGKLHLYKGDKEVTSYNVGTGANVGDEQTKTVVRNGKVYWNEGNKTTGAGIYEVSGVTPNNPDYSNAPSWNFKNEYGIEVPMAIHSSFGSRTAKIRDNDPSNNRLSTGCINGICYNLEDLYKRGYKQGQKLYVLPDDENNTYEISNGKLIFKSKNPNVNRTSNTLNYKPIKVELDEKTFREKVFTAFDINDEEEFNNSTKPFAQALADNKQKIMKAAKVNGDTYNDIAKIAFGIYGTESNFGDTHSAVGNLARAVNKYFNMGSSSSPDYKSKATTYGANKDSNSVGLTQIRFNMLDDSEKNILRELGITSNEQLLNPKDSAIATAAILATRYNNQLTDAEKKDIETYLPKKWNTRANYSERVKNNSQYLKIKELN